MFSLEGTKKKAIAYYRHSAEDKQENSVTIQNDHAEEFVAQHDLGLIHYESDEGVSGLSASRPGFERLFDEWITNPDAPEFHYVLVLDETRWGRWQDPDEAAYWTMICKKHGKQVIYMSRGFPKDEQKLLSSLETSIGRYMAAEYSRQLSDKVWHGSMKVTEQGFSAGGTAPYGYTRVLFDESHQRVGQLKPGQHKVIANQRVTFEPADDETPKVVQRIFDLFVNDWLHPEDIAERLNEDGILSATGRLWDISKITRVLSNETYTGTLIYNKTWNRLKEKQRKNPIDEWVRCVDAFEAIIGRGLFEQAQERLYWIMPSHWKHGVYKLNRTKRTLQNYVEGLIKDYDADLRFEVLRRLPISYGLTYYRAGIARRCFRITEEMRQHEEIIGISVDMFKKDKIDALFALPTNNFGIGDYLVLNDNDKEVAHLKIEGDVAKEKVLNLCDAIRV
jgi:DNA invertase Pin-like site-specific DNA recombinase